MWIYSKKYASLAKIMLPPAQCAIKFMMQAPIHFKLYVLNVRRDTFYNSLVKILQLPNASYAAHSSLIVNYVNKISPPVKEIVCNVNKIIF